MIAYCLLVHKNPNQVFRLMKKIYTQQDNYYINIFNSNSNIAEDEWKDALKAFPEDNVFISFRYGNSWGTFELVDATLDSMKYFAKLDYQYFINLSGQDYPLKNIDYIKSRPGKKNISYVDYIKMPPYKQYTSKEKREELPPSTRYFARHEYIYYRMPFSTNIKKLVSKFRNIIRFDTPIFIKVPRVNKKLLYKFNFYVGSQWFCLSKPHVNYILKFLEDNPGFSSFFRHTLVPDEHFFHTIIMNSNIKHEVVNDNLRHIVWKRDPVIFTSRDAETLIQIPKLFARKFDIEVDSKILDIIDECF